MQQLTIRGLGEELEERIRSLAEKEDISLSIRLLRRGAGLEGCSPAEDVIGSSLDHLAGTWSAEEAEFMDQVEEDFECIGPGLWS